MHSVRTPRQVIIRPHRPWLIPVAVIFVLALVLSEGWFVFDYGQTYGRSELVKLHTERDRLKNVVKHLGQQNSEFRQRLAILERGGQIDRLAYAEVEKKLKELEEEKVELKEELEFYRGIVAPNSNERGLQIQSFKMGKTEDERTYRYKLVLVQLLKNDRLITGQVVMDVQGMQAGKTISLSWQMIAVKNKKVNPANMVFKFKYFQNIEGDITLPDGFTPGRVTVEVISQGGNSVNVKKTFGWQELAG